MVNRVLKKMVHLSRLETVQGGAKTIKSHEVWALNPKDDPLLRKRKHRRKQ